jgi:hypothetical protein
MKMSGTEYLDAVLKSQVVSAEELEALRNTRSDVQALLEEAFSQCSPTIRYGGSKAKGTMIKENYDLDLICYFEHDDTAAGDTLEDIFRNAEKALQKSYVIHPKRSALRLYDPSGRSFLHVDVVPGRFTDDTKSDVFLFQAEGEKKRLKTNLQVHIDHIAGSGVTDCIKLAKLWALRNGVPVKTFVLELAVVEVLRGKSGKSLSYQFAHMLETFRDSIEDVRIEDPANPTGNDLSPIFDAGLRSHIALVAGSSMQSVDADSWNDILGPIADESSSAGLHDFQVAAARVTSDSKPWSEGQNDK